MGGITSYGAYVPSARLPLAAMAGGAAAAKGPEKAVAAFDEDSATMAVAACVDCLRGLDRARIDALYFASTTYDYREKQGAALIARALDLRRDVATADYGGSLRAGTAALRGALDAVGAGSARNVLVVASDCRMGAPRGALDRSFGDAAAAFLVGADEPALVAEGAHAVADEILDVWRTDGDRFTHSWEDRFAVLHGYRENTMEAVKGLLHKLGAGPTDFDRVALYAPDARAHGGAVRALKLEPATVQNPLFGRVGNAGAAFAPLLFAAALEDAKPGERVLLASYGDGAEALALRATEHLEKLGPRRGVRGHLARRRVLRDYDTYLRARSLDTREWQAGGGGGVSATVHWRERDADVGLKGQRCRSCGTEQYPPQRVCYRCYALDELDLVRLSDRTGRVLSYTFDYFFPSAEPPTVAGMVEAEGGCRLYLQMTDADPAELRCDLPVEFVFRKIHDAGGKPNYYWKSTPLRSDSDE